MSEEQPLMLIGVHPPDLAEQIVQRLSDGGVLVHLQEEGAKADRNRAAARGGVGRGGRVQIYVRPEDFDQARRIESRFMRELMPDLPEDFDPENLDPNACPACETELPRGTVGECPECGLALLEVPGNTPSE